MAPPPPKDKFPTIDDDPYPKQRGERRNFMAVSTEPVHVFPVGTIVYMKIPDRNRPMGPLIIVELSKPLFHGGPPQYICAPYNPRNPDDSIWEQCDEAALREVRPNDPRLNQFFEDIEYAWPPPPDVDEGYD